MSKFGLDIYDFVDIKENYSSFIPENMIHICKRKNNSKRQFLFVNRYQGKHIPVDPVITARLYTELFERIGVEFSSEKHKGERVVIVGFAETATAIGESIAYLMTLAKTLPVEFVHYLQTSRENYNCPKLFDFSEEHSHAVNQYLYCKDMPKDYDRVLFIEDEITTGKTILNFIAEFKKINSNCKYSVASILNWQRKDTIKIFEDNDIDRIYLVSGELKGAVPNIHIEENEVLDYFTVRDAFPSDNGIKPREIISTDARVGISRATFDMPDISRFSTANNKLLELIEKDDKIMIVGTEEFMFYPLVMSVISRLSVSFGFCKDIKFRATTRSPITPSKMVGYEIQDGIVLPSAYDADRMTYLYNLNEGKDYDKMIVITEKGATNEFINALSAYCKDYNIKYDVIFV